MQGVKARISCGLVVSTVSLWLVRSPDCLLCDPEENKQFGVDDVKHQEHDN